MNTPEAPQSTQDTLFDLVKRNEKKKAPLIEAMKVTRINRDNVAEFVTVMNSVPAPLAAELISIAWPELDGDRRLSVIREWLDGKSNDQQIRGFHNLSARLLTVDPENSMGLLDRVVKCIGESAELRQLAITLTDSEWIGTMPDTAPFAKLKPNLFKSNSRLAIFDWIADSCNVTLQPTDNEKKRADKQKQAMARTSLVIEWFKQLQQEKEMPEHVAEAVEKNLAKLLPKTPKSPVSNPSRIEAAAEPIGEVINKDTTPTVKALSLIHI